MAEDSYSMWLAALERQAGIRRGILVHGNVLDTCYCSDTSDYQPLVQTLAHALRRKGFDHVVVWDRFSGMDNVSAAVKDQLRRDAAGLTCPSHGPASASESEYDVGPARTPPASPAGNTPEDPADFFAVVYHHMLNQTRTRYAFVIDWSQYLFGNTNSLTEQERGWLLMLSKAIRNAPSAIDGESASRPQNTVILLCGKLGGIPPALYQGNPAIQEIAVPGPSRADRELFVKRTLDRWRLRITPRPGEAAFNDFVDSLDGLSLRDLEQLLRLSRQTTGEPLTGETLVNLYKYGEQKSPWEDLNRAKLATIRESLARRVKGQDEAIDKVARVIIRAHTGLSGLQHSKKQKMPKGSLFFVGPTGVGKTELAKSLAQFLFGDEEACIRFDMSEFNHEHSDQRLVGAPPGYVGYEEGGQLTNAVKRRPFCVLLFDEIEKAHVRILDKFLQILEDGRLTDGKGETVYFAETVIIFTSNIGASDVVNDPENPEVTRQQFIEKVREHFVSQARRPELLNRIGDNIVPFNFITGTDFLKAIARSKIGPLRDRLKEKYRIIDLVFVDEDRALDAIARSVDSRMGGRAVANQITALLIDPLATFLFTEQEDDRAYTGKTIRIHQVGNEPHFLPQLD